MNHFIELLNVKQKTAVHRLGAAKKKSRKKVQNITNEPDSDSISSEYSLSDSSESLDSGYYKRAQCSCISLYIKPLDYDIPLHHPHIRIFILRDISRVSLNPLLNPIWILF